MVSSQIRDHIWISCIVRWRLYHWATREAPVFFFFFEFTSSNRCVVLICNFLMIYDFWVFLICLFSICMFSLARCSDLYIFNEAVCSRFFGIIWVYNLLSDMYFVDIFLCGLCLGFLNKVFYEFIFNFLKVMF